jgi:hypothetical protein
MGKWEEEKITVRGKRVKEKKNFNLSCKKNIYTIE